MFKLIVNDGTTTPEHLHNKKMVDIFWMIFYYPLSPGIINIGTEAQENTYST